MRWKTLETAVIVGGLSAFCWEGFWGGRREPAVQCVTRREPCHEDATFGGAKGDNGLGDVAGNAVVVGPAGACGAVRDKAGALARGFGGDGNGQRVKLTFGQW
ncbi:hypothetical protein CGZ80_02020 [Rhodopirellula sp. MGV]|nr:hypothetical protein CGZ80_02020 [Rhodopirellula sp. MGV]